MKQIIDGGFIASLESRDLRIKNPMNGLFGGNRRSKVYGNSSEFADYREYFPGDDLRRIDWNLYGRFEKLFLKLFVDERQLHHKIYIDGSASMDWGTPEKSNIALKLAAAIGYLSVQAMDRVSFYVIHEDTVEDISGTVVGRESFYNAANLLNEIDFYGESEIGLALSKIENPGNGDGLSIIISDFLTDKDFKSGIDYLRFHNREVHLIQVLARDEVSPDINGKVLMLDSESIDEDDLKNYKSEITKTSIKAYAEALTFHQNDIKKFCAGRDTGFFTVINDESIEKMLFMKATEVGLIS